MTFGLCVVAPKPQQGQQQFRGQTCDQDQCPYCQVRINERTGECSKGCPTGAIRVRRMPPALTNNSPAIRRFWDLLVELDYERYGTPPNLSVNQRIAVRWWLDEA